MIPDPPGNSAHFCAAPLSRGPIVFPSLSPSPCRSRLPGPCRSRLPGPWRGLSPASGRVPGRLSGSPRGAALAQSPGRRPWGSPRGAVPGAVSRSPRRVSQPPRIRMRVALYPFFPVRCHSHWLTAELEGRPHRAHARKRSCAALDTEWQPGRPGIRGCVPSQAGPDGHGWPGLERRTAPMQAGGVRSGPLALSAAPLPDQRHRCTVVTEQYVRFWLTAPRISPN